MKSCNKITAIVISVILVISVFCGLTGVAAESEAATTCECETTAYVHPGNYDPNAETTASADISDLIDEDMSQKLEDAGQTIRESSNVFEKFLSRLNEFFDAIVEFLSSLADFSWTDYLSAK